MFSDHFSHHLATITLGIHSPEELLRLMKSAGQEINAEAEEAILHMAIASEPREVDLIAVTVKDLFFPIGTHFTFAQAEVRSFGRILDKALSHGLEHCIPEVGPVLSLVSHFNCGNVLHDWFRIGMDPELLKGSTFSVHLDKDPKFPNSVICSQTTHDGEWGFRKQMVFIRPRQSKVDPPTE